MLLQLVPGVGQDALSVQVPRYLKMSLGIIHLSQIFEILIVTVGIYFSQIFKILV